MKSIRRKKNQCIEGDIVRIGLDDGYYAFGRKLESPLWVFFGGRSHGEISTSDILRLPIIFKVWAREKEGIATGKWQIIGNIPLTEAELKPVPFFKQNVLDPSDIAIYMSNSRGEETPASWNEIQELENVAVWESDHIISRLQDFFAGRPNKWVEALKPKKQA